MKDLTVMGIGHAATRDFLSFLRHAAEDDFGNPVQFGPEALLED
jgi:hypothetical protein